MTVKITFEMFEQAVKELEARFHTSYLTPEQTEQFKKCNAELGKAFLEGRLKIVDIERNGFLHKLPKKCERRNCWHDN